MTPQLRPFLWFALIGVCLLALLCGCGRKATAPPGGSFVAYSLRVAQHQLQASGGSRADLLGLGGITRIAGLVHDPETDDLILVGQVDRTQPPSTLDDLVVALRALLVEKCWPLVSIDRTPETRVTGKQKVQFKGGIQGTQFGKDLLEADIALKKLALGLLPADTWGGRSYSDLSADDVRARGQPDTIGSRFWFYPVNPALAVREGVFAISSLKIGVLTDVLSLDGRPVSREASVRDPIGDRFSGLLTANYDRVCAVHPEVARLKRLFDMVAVAKGIQGLPNSPDLSYWLRDYPIPPVETAPEYPLLQQSQTVSTTGRNLVMQVEGGVELRALVLRLGDGDATALREIVLKSRPKREALTWQLPLEGWHIPGTPAGYTPLADSLPAAVGNLGCYVSRTVRPAEQQSGLSGDLPLLPPSASLPDFTFGTSLRPPTSPVSGLATSSGAGIRDPGGVEMNPELKHVGKGGAETKEQVVKSRPSRDAVCWPVGLNESDD